MVLTTLSINQSAIVPHEVPMYLLLIMIIYYVIARSLDS